MSTKQFTPFFYQIRIVNKVICCLTHEDFCTDIEEGNSLVKLYSVMYPEPAYKVAFSKWPLEPVSKEKK